MRTRFLRRGATASLLLHVLFIQTPAAQTFTKTTDSPIVAPQKVTGGGSRGDYDNDGDLDLYVSNYSLITSEDDRRNELYLNNGDGIFTAVAGISPVLGSTVSPSSVWVDYDDDGDLDLYVNNWIFTLGGAPQPLPNVLFENHGDGTFSEVTAGPLVTDINVTWNSTWSDLDRDGDLDLFVANGISVTQNFGPQPNPNFLYRNDSGNTKNWITISLRGDASNHFGLGATIFVTATVQGESKRQVRQIMGHPTSDRSYAPYRAHFGLDDATVIDNVLVRWPSGRVTERTGVAANQFLTISESEDDPPTAIDGEPAIPDRIMLHGNYPNPFNPTTTVRFTLMQAEEVQLSVHDITGRRIRIVQNRTLPPGTHEVRFDAEDLPSGLYLYRLQVGATSRSRMMILRK